MFYCGKNEVGPSYHLHIHISTLLSYKNCPLEAWQPIKNDKWQPVTLCIYTISSCVLDIPWEKIQFLLPVVAKRCHTGPKCRMNWLNFEPVYWQWQFQCHFFIRSESVFKLNMKQILYLVPHLHKFDHWTVFAPTCMCVWSFCVSVCGGCDFKSYKEL